MIQHQEISRTIGIRIKALRILRSMSPAQMAEVLGSKTNRVTRVEKGASPLTATELVAVAQALGVKTSVLVGEEEYSGGAS